MERCDYYNPPVYRPDNTPYQHMFENMNPIAGFTSAEYTESMARAFVTQVMDGNLKTIEDDYKESLDKLYTDEFKRIYLFNTKRDIKNIYTSAQVLHNMGITGSYDLFSALTTAETMRYFPLIESFNTEDIIDSIQVDAPSSSEGSLTETQIYPVV
jgi:hypothetical protein